MRVFALFLASLLLCSCERAPAERPIEKAKAPVEVGKERPPVQDDWKEMFKISDRVFDRYMKLGYEKLSPAEKVFQCIWGLEAEVNNGGFNQYYFNSAGDHAADTVKSLETIGANHTANLVRRGNALFGEAGPSPDRFKRQKELFALEDAGKSKEMESLTKEFLKYNDPLGKMLEAYVSKNAEAFRTK
jgi:hypothetical protein